MLLKKVLTLKPESRKSLRRIDHAWSVFLRVSLEISDNTDSSGKYHPRGSM